MAESEQNKARPGVLVVEDEPDAQKLMEMILGARYEVWLAASDREMYERLAENGERVGIILMDISLHGSRDGLELTRALRDEGRKLPIVVVTAHDSSEHRRRASEVGSTAFLTKPVRPRQILSLIDSLLQAA